jgi:proline racemase
LTDDPDALAATREADVTLTQGQVVRTYTGPTREAAEHAYRADAARALAGGYAPVSHRWTQDARGLTLIVAYQRLTIEEDAVPREAEPETIAEAVPNIDEVQQPEGSAEPESAAEGEVAAEVEAAAEPEAAAEVETAAEPEAAAEVETAAEPEAAAEPATDVSTQTDSQSEDSEEYTKPIERPAEQIAAEQVAPVLPAGRSAKLTIQVLDMHCAGEPLRMIRAGFPDVPDLPVLERRRWVAENADEIRRSIILEPRGHSDMYGAILLPSHRSDADICLLFMHNEGYSTMCGHGVIAVTTALLEEGLFPASVPTTTIRYEVPAGLVVATASTAQLEDGGVAVGGVSFVNVPSYLAARSLAIAPDGLELHGAAAECGHLSVDLAFGGAYYGIVDAASLGLRVVPDQASALRRAGAAITDVLRRDHTPTHPTDPDLGFVYGTIIIDRDAASSPDGRALDAHLRNVTIFADAELDRSPCGSGTSALLAHLFYRGAIQVGEAFVNAGITGEAFVGRVEGQTRIGDQPAIMTSVSGQAFVTGYSTLIVDERDPLGSGFLLR